MTDRELLDLAAKAAGLLKWGHAWVDAGLNMGSDACPAIWNPLANDGDALRLAVKLEIETRNFNGKSHAGRQGKFWCTEAWFPDGDPYAATRRAIVRAAATIGEAMP